MKKLIVYAHPRVNSFNQCLVEGIEKASIEKRHTVEKIDLYNQYPQPFLHLSHEVIPYQKEIHTHIMNADEIIFVFPIRRMDCPAIMKNFLDNNFSRGFAYQTNDRGKQVGLLSGKTVRIVATAGGASFFYPFIWFFIRKIGRIKYCGMKHISTHILAHTITTTNTKRQKFIETVIDCCSR